MADVKDITRARRALARAERVLGLIARRYADVVDDSGDEPWVDKRYIHWPANWLRQASQEEIFAWIAHYSLAWALGHDWRIFRRLNYDNFTFAFYQRTPQRAASLIETSCFLYFSDRPPRGWRPLITDPNILERWRGIPAEKIIEKLQRPRFYNYTEDLHSELINENPRRDAEADDEGDYDAAGDTDGDGPSDGDSAPGADGDEDSDLDEDPDTDGDAETHDDADSAAAIFDAISDGDGDADGNVDSDADDDGDGSDEDDSDGDADTEGDTLADPADDAEDSDLDDDPDTDGDARDADADDDADRDADTADGCGDQPVPASWRVSVKPPAEPIWVQTLLLAASGSDHPEPLRHHRRHASSPILIPARRGDGAIVVSRDCSGSISHGQLEAATVAVRALRAAHQDAEIILVDHDCEIARVVYDPTERDLSVRPCAGGTDFRPVFAEAERLQASGVRIACLVLISADLDGGMPYHDEEPHYPVVWITSYRMRSRPPFGEVIRYL